MTTLKTWLALTQTPALNARHLHKIQTQISLDDFIKLKSSQLTALGLTDVMAQQIVSIDWSLVGKSEQWLENNNHYLLPYTLQDFPPLLREISDPPVAIYVDGQLEKLNTPQIAIVGSRKALPQSLEIAHEFSTHLSQAGLTITSGLALGIDANAHQATLTYNGTIAVLGSGLLNIYPRSNSKLALKIRQTGAIISEFPLNSVPEKWHFPRRNRIIAGLSLATLVIEAGFKSGSLITANLAASFGRDVFVIPGSIRQSHYRGSHYLIKSGAYLVDSAAELIPALQQSPLMTEYYPKVIISDQKIDIAQQNRYNHIEKTIKDPILRRLMQSIGDNVTPIEFISQRSEMSVEKCISLLTELELANYISAVAGGYTKTR